MSLFLGLDIGTSAVKAIIVDAEDRERASAEAPLSIERPQPLWSEQHPDVWVDRLPAKFREAGPQIVEVEGGRQVWKFEDKLLPNVGLNAVAEA